MELIVETHGVLVSKHQGRLRVMRDKEKLQEVPLVMLEQVLITSNGVAVTSDVVRVCSENGIPIHFVNGDGRSYGTLYSSGLTGTIQTRRAQLEAYTDERGAALAHAFVRGKLENQVNLLRAMAKNRRENDPDCFEETQWIVGEIRDALAAAEDTVGKTCDEIRLQLLAAEGRGAERYWTGVRRLLLADLDWPGRQTQGATDPLNSTLNYGYGILYARVSLIAPSSASSIANLRSRSMKMGGSMNRHAGDWGSISRTVWIRPSVTKASASASASFSNPRRATLPPL